MRARGLPNTSGVFWEGNCLSCTEFRLMSTRWRQLWELESSHVIVPRLEIADSFWRKTVGLLGRRSLDADSGLWFEPCNGIHTIGMRFPIDVVFLDKNGAIMRLASNVRPWRICGPVRGAKVVIELPKGAIASQGLQCGQRVMLTSHAPPEFDVSY